MRVFNISPQRSGTKSFHALCAAHGLKAAHYPGEALDDRAGLAVPGLDTDRLWDMYQPDYYTRSEVFSDFPTSMIYDQALTSFPNAKFILVYRDPESWVRSVRKITFERDLSWLERFFYHKYCHPTWGQMGLDPYEDHELAQGYSDFCTQSAGRLMQRGADLLVARLEDRRLDKKIADFIGFTLTAPMGHID